MKKVALIILDGFGITAEERGNAVLSAKTPNLDSIILRYPKCLLKASSEEVGLPWGEIGNSEVGHSNIGLGRVVLQDLPQIDASIENHLIEKKDGIIKAKESLQKTPANVNIIFLASNGAIHGHIRHLAPLIKIFENSAAQKIVLHLISDGRDVPDGSLNNFVKQIKTLLTDRVVIGSVSGRYYTMDRDKNYDRTKLSYDAIMGNSTVKSSDIDEAIKNAYQKKETDEFIIPVTIGNLPKANLDNDIFVFTNYRADRALQLTRSFVDLKFDDFSRGDKTCKNFITMTTYDDNLSVSILYSNLDLFDKQKNSLANSLSKLIAKEKLTQFHVAESEKYAHVTYFFSGTKEIFPNVVNKLIPSDKVKSYDLKPKMKVKEISDEIIAHAEKGTDFILANIANGDMVGHSGNLEATIKSVEITDDSIGRIVDALTAKDYSIFICADHGNCDQMIDLKTGKKDKEHSLNPVPFIHISKETLGSYQTKSDFFLSAPIGVLADIAPTILSALEINLPVEMTGMNLMDSLS